MPSPCHFEVTMCQVCFEASVIRDDDRLTIWVAASVTPRLVFDALDDYWEQDSATIDDCTDCLNQRVSLTLEEERELELIAISHYYDRRAAKREATQAERDW
jgi:hypothetical protein